MTGYDESRPPPLLCARRGTDVLSGSCRHIRSEGSDHSGGQRPWRPIEVASSTDTETPEDIALRAEVSAARRDDTGLEKAGPVFGAEPAVRSVRWWIQD